MQYADVVNIVDWRYRNNLQLSLPESVVWGNIWKAIGAISYVGCLKLPLWKWKLTGPILGSRRSSYSIWRCIYEMCSFPESISWLGIHWGGLEINLELYIDIHCQHEQKRNCLINKYEQTIFNLFTHQRIKRWTPNKIISLLLSPLRICWSFGIISLRVTKTCNLEKYMDKC